MSIAILLRACSRRSTSNCTMFSSNESNEKTRIDEAKSLLDLQEPRGEIESRSKIRDSKHLLRPLRKFPLTLTIFA